MQIDHPALSRIFRYKPRLGPSPPACADHDGMAIFTHGQYDSILNKTSISYKANRKIGGDAPSVYLPRIQSEKQVGLADEQMDKLLSSHALSTEILRSDSFDEFIEDRRKRLSQLVAKAMGKPVSQISEAEDYGESDE